MQNMEKMSDPYREFLFALNSPVSKERYSTRLRCFFRFLQVHGSMEERCRLFVEKAKEEPKWAYESVIRFLQYEKDRCERKEITGSTVRGYYKAVKLFMEVNDILIPWNKIKRGIPKGRRYADDRIPTIDEIKQLLKYPDRRMKAIISVMASSGIRLGAWDYLKWEHVKPIEQNGQIVAAEIRVYAGEEEEYYSFITPEAYNELNEWMKYRQDSGEKITGGSWLMRDLWDTGLPRGGFVSTPKRLKSSGIKRLMERALWAQKLRRKLPQGKRRHEFSANHSFRKYFHTMCHKAGVKPVIAELLLGHSIGLGDNYYRPTKEELLGEYLKAVNELTISDENRLKTQIDILSKEGHSSEEEKLQLRAMQQKYDRDIRMLRNAITEIRLAQSNRDKLKKGAP